MAGVLFAAWGYIDAGDNAPAYFAVVEAALGFIVPALFVAGLAGLYAGCEGREGWLGRLGFALSFLGSGWGIVHQAHVEFGWPPRFGWLPGLWIWLPGLWTGLALVGLAAIRTKALGGWGTLPLAMGMSGWVYYLTDFGGMVEVRSVHVAFGVLFSLSWMALGYALRSRRIQ